jgi:hypothetical protein
MLRKISITLNMLLCVVFAVLMAIHIGFERGYDQGSYDSAQGISFAFSGGTPYGWLSQNYLILTLCSLVFFVGQMIKGELLSKIVCILSFLIAVRPLYFLYEQKMFLVSRPEAFNQLIRETIPLDWLCFLTMIVLLAYQVVGIFQYFLHKNRTTLNTI